MNFSLGLSVNNLTDFLVYEQASSVIRIDGKLPFVEILWDNYCHLEPDKLVEYLSRFSDRIAFHVMWSRFLDRDKDEFQEFLHHLKFHVDEVQPFYVSDHICTFHIGSAYAKAGLEYSYSDVDEVCRKIDYYQNYLGRRVLFENFASMAAEGYKQVEFFDTLITRTGCDVLFDISNARVAENNGFGALTDWIDLLHRVKGLQCHVGGYEYMADFHCYRDSHGDPISQQTLCDIEMVCDRLDVQSLCYEREHNRTSEAMANDLTLLKSLQGVVS